MNWLRALWRKLFESHEPKTPTPHHPDVAAGEFEAAWKGKSERLPVDREAARMQSALDRLDEAGAKHKNAVVRRCWLCHAGVVVTKEDPDTPVVCIECKDKSRPNPPRAAG